MHLLSSCSLRPLSRLSCNMAHRLRPTALRVWGSFLRKACVPCHVNLTHAHLHWHLHTCENGFWWTQASTFAPWSIWLLKNGRRAQTFQVKSAPFGANIKNLLPSFKDRATGCNSSERRIVLGCLRPLERPVEVAQFRRRCWRSLAQLAWARLCSLHSNWLDCTPYKGRFRLIMITQLIWCTFTILYVSAYMFGSDIATHYIMES